MLALYIVLGFIAFSIAGHFVTIYLIFLKFFKRTSLKHIDKSSRNTPYSKPYAEEMIATRNELIDLHQYEMMTITSFDGLKLSGYYFNSNSDKTIIMVHGLRTHAFNNFGLAIKYFLKHNYNILAINQRAHEGSEGKYTTYGQKESEDVISWVNHISDMNEIKSIYLYGISMGATSIALASERIKNKKVKFLIIESVYTSVNALTEYIIKSQHIPGFLFRRGVRFLSKHVAGVDWSARTTVDALKNNHIPSIFVHGTKDIVAIESFFEDNYNNCVSNKYSIIVKDAPHALCALHDREKYLDKLEKIIGDKYE